MLDKAYSESTLCGKTALVTGGTSKIGREICVLLAQHGVNVAVHYHQSCRAAQKLCNELEQRGVLSWHINADFEKEGEVETLVERTISQTGSLDIVINNASVFTETVHKKHAWPDLSLNLKANTRAPLVISREFKRLAGRGAIINLLDSRIRGGDPYHAGYILSKRILAALIPKMALEFAPGITVNAVAPGLIVPPSSSMNSASLKKLSANLPLKRHGTPRDVARAIVFLLESHFITGQVIYVDGGRNLRETALP